MNTAGVDVTVPRYISDRACNNKPYLKAFTIPIEGLIHNKNINDIW